MGMLAFVGGASAGAALVYFLDPDRGRRRRALLRDQLVHVSTLARREAPKKSRHLANQMQGVIAETKSQVEDRIESGIPSERREAGREEAA